MKGRVTIEKMNQAVDEFQKMLESKYKILSNPIGKLTGEPLKKFKVSILLQRWQIFRFGEMKKAPNQKEHTSFLKTTLKPQVWSN